MALTVMLASVPAAHLTHCASAESYGWPRFDSLEQLKADSKWSSYFDAVYGSPPERYPVCVFDFWYIDAAAYVAAGLNGTRPVVHDPKQLKEGDLFSSVSTTGVGYSIYHSSWTPVPNNTWVEVAHAVYPTELVGAWVWTQPGTGIYANVGRTLVFPTPADKNKIHAKAIAWLQQGCSVNISKSWPQMESDLFGLCAREKGYDSIQFEPQEGQVPLGTFGLVGLVEMVLVNLDGMYTCGVANASETPLRSGWDAARACDCENEPIADSCGLMSRPPFPFSITGEQPRLCEKREESRWNKCDTSTCSNSRCKI